MISLRKLAELAGVSHLSVWRALHNRPGINPQVRAQILALAEQHHYHVNRLAEGLFTGNTRTIGHITPTLKWGFHARVAEGVAQAAVRAQDHCIIMPLYNDNSHRHTIATAISQLIEQRVDGIVILTGGIADVISTKSILEMRSHGVVPVAICDSLCEKPIDRTLTDERKIAQLVVEYLLHLGHTRIAFCGLDARYARNQEMRRAFQSYGLSLEYFIEEANLTAPDPDGAEEVLDQLYHKPYPPTAIICFGDQMATQLLHHAQHRGLRTPGDLSILGCSNDMICGFLTPALTSVEQQPEELGRRAFDLIQRRRREEIAAEDWAPETLFVQPKLIIRESCSPPESPRRVHLRGFTPALNPSDHTAHDTAQVTPEIERLVRACDAEYGKHDLMVRLGLRHTEHFRRAYLIPALEAGYVERTIPEKPHSKKQRYRLTKKGQIWRCALTSS